MTFAEFLEDAARKGDVVNTVFEERLFGLVRVLHKIADALSAEGVPYELVGGMAVLVHVEEDPAQTMLTGNVDILARRSDLGRIEATGQTVRLLFSGERVSPAQSAPNPPIEPENKFIHGKSVAVIPVPALVAMKLSSYRLKDQVHIQVMDAAGLITEAIERSLPPELVARLERVRRSE